LTTERKTHLDLLAKNNLSSRPFDWSLASSDFVRNCSPHPLSCSNLPPEIPARCQTLEPTPRDQPDSCSNTSSSCSAVLFNPSPHDRSILSQPLSFRSSSSNDRQVDSCGKAAVAQPVSSCVAVNQSTDSCSHESPSKSVTFRSVSKSTNSCQTVIQSTDSCQTVIQCTDGCPAVSRSLDACLAVSQDTDSFPAVSQYPKNCPSQFAENSPLLGQFMESCRPPVKQSTLESCITDAKVSCSWSRCPAPANQGGQLSWSQAFSQESQEIRIREGADSHSVKTAGQNWDCSGDHNAISSNRGLQGGDSCRAWSADISLAWESSWGSGTAADSSPGQIRWHDQIQRSLEVGANSDESQLSSLTTLSTPSNR
jgi:hypothetical protein